MHNTKKMLGREGGQTGRSFFPELAHINQLIGLRDSVLLKLL